MHISSSVAPLDDSNPRKKTTIRTWMTSIIVGLLVIGAAAALYTPTLHHGVVLDDRSYVMENPYLADATSFLYPLNLADFVASAPRLGLNDDIALNFITRPITYATFYWNRMAGGLDTAGYRIVNIAIHATNGVLVFALAVLLGRLESARRLIAPAIAALLFTVHPLMTESVTYITQRFESLSTMFGLLAVLIWFKGTLADESSLLRLLRPVAVMLTLAAMLSKEIGVTIPALIVLADWLCFGTPLVAALKRSVPQLLCLPLLPLMIAATSFIMHGQELSVETLVHITNDKAYPVSVAEYFLTEICVSVTYLRLLLLPTGLNFDADYRHVTSLGDIHLLLALAVIAVLFAGAWRLRRRWGAADGGVILFGLVWYFVALSPSSSFVPLPDAYAEHRSYLPAVGLFIALSVLIQRLLEQRAHKSWRVGWHALATIWIGALCYGTVLRNDVLRDDESIYRDVVEKSPKRWRAWNGLGTALARQKRIQEACICFEKAVGCPPAAELAFINLATCQLILKTPDQAAETCRQGLEIFPESPKLHHNYGMALFDIGQSDTAVAQFRLALESAPEMRQTNLCLAQIFYHAGKTRQALAHLRTAANTGPLTPQDQRLLDTLASAEVKTPGTTDFAETVAR